MLIVDDNLEYAQNIAEILEIEGCATEIFETAEEALPVALSSRVTVVITDFRLPGMNGIELVTRIFRERGRLPAAVMSACAEGDTEDAARRLGVEFLDKPVDFAALDRVVHAAAARSRPASAKVFKG